MIYLYVGGDLVIPACATYEDRFFDTEPNASKSLSLITSSSATTMDNLDICDIKSQRYMYEKLIYLREIQIKE